MKNSQPLPLIKPYTGPKLPPDRYCLSSANYRLKSLKKVSDSYPPVCNIITCSVASEFSKK